MADESTAEVDCIEFEELDEPECIYIFEVKDFHIYYVSDLALLVHNTCPKTVSETRVVKNLSGGMRAFRIQYKPKEGMWRANSR